MAPAPPNRRRAFTPFHAPARPPSGTYDPALDAQERAGNRGLSDLVADVGPVGRLTERATSDYGLGLGEIDRQAGYATQDLDRGLSRAVEDHDSATAGLTRRYGMLANSQADQQAAAGVDGGGSVLAAALMRRGNQAVEQAPIDTSLARYRADDTVNRTRLGENVAAEKGSLGLGYRRQGEDFATQLERAGRENTQFGLDLSEQRFYQAEQSGYAPPHAPANEHTKRDVTYRVRGQGPGRVYTLPNGRQLTRDEWINMWRQRRHKTSHPVGQGALSG